MNDAINSFVKSRRFWLAVSCVAVALLKDKLPLTEEQIQNIVLTIGAWIIGESLRSSQSKPDANTTAA